jgi:hypothetical protein
LDRIHWDDEKFSENLRVAEKETAEYLFLKHDLKPNERYAKDELGLLPFFWTRPKLLVLCRVAGVTVPMGWCRVLFWILLQKHVPAYRFFRNRWDRWLVKWLAVLQIGVFLYLISLATWEWQIFPCTSYLFFGVDACHLWRQYSTTEIVPALYIESATVLLTICVIGGLSQRLQSIRDRCKKLAADIDAKVDGILARVLKYLSKRNNKSGNAAPPSPPPPSSGQPPALGPPPAPPPALGPPA